MATVMANLCSQKPLKTNRMVERSNRRRIINLNEDFVDIMDAFIKLEQKCETEATGLECENSKTLHHPKLRRTDENCKDEAAPLKQNRNEIPEIHEDTARTKHIRKRMESLGFDVTEDTLYGDNTREKNSTGSKPCQEESDEYDEGHLQCTIRFENRRSILILQSMTVRATLSPGMPGFLVSIILLPRKTESVRSKVYVTAQKDIDLSLRETFRLKCTKEDLKDSSLFISVNPMFGNSILFAEAELKELNLENGYEVQLGGYLKSMLSYPDH